MGATPLILNITLSKLTLIFEQLKKRKFTFLFIFSLRKYDKYAIFKSKRGLYLFTQKTVKDITKLSNGI